MVKAQSTNIIMIITIITTATTATIIIIIITIIIIINISNDHNSAENKVSTRIARNSDLKRKRKRGNK